VENKKRKKTDEHIKYQVENTVHNIKVRSIIHVIYKQMHNFSEDIREAKQDIRE
jgi:hypothetical protein